MTGSRPVSLATAILMMLAASEMVRTADPTYAAGSASADVPPRSEGGQALAVTEEHLELGEVYHVVPATGTQLTVTADAPLMRVIATCNRVVGCVVTPFDVEEGDTPLLAGALRIPMASLGTGNEQYDAEFHGPQGFNTTEHPEMTFRITGVSDVKSAGDEKGRRRYTLTVAGELKVKDKTLELELPMRLTLVPFTWQTMQLNLGDFVVLRTAFDVKTADLGLEPPPRFDPDFDADVAHFDLYLLCSTVSPEKNIDPSIKHEHYRKQLRFLTLVRDFDDPDKGYEFGRAFMREIWDDAQALGRLAAATLTEEGIKTRDLGFALKAALRANELTGFEDPALLGTLARAHFEKAELDTALKWARQAADHLEGAPPGVATEIRSLLERYEAHAAKRKE